MNHSHNICVPIRRAADVTFARHQGRCLAHHLGMSAAEQSAIDIAIAEIATNIITHANYGEILFSPAGESDPEGILIVARDQGPGIIDLDRAMQDGYSTRGSLGLGLPGAKRMMDQFHIHTEANKGTTITMTKWKRQHG